jgi:hypothetical protein
VIDYTIMEYNIETKKYRTIGIAEGIDARQARASYVKRHKWKPRENIMLFAKPPVCR